MFSLAFSCEKEDANKAMGKYSVALSYNGNEYLELFFVMDGVEVGKFIPVPNVNPSYVRDCDALNHVDDLINVMVFKKISVGKHTLEIKTSEGNVIKTLAFEMLDRECVFQDASISFD